MNRLATEKAAYLKHSAHQRIDWYPWCEEAFERAKAEDKPVFLSSGAIWCHWCHVMAKECFEDEEVVKLLNDNCINIKLDRDERPDIDRIYQQAVAAMGSGGGWPLSIFLTPEKKPFFGGTYFPLEDSYGRPGFRKVVETVADFYRSRKDEISAYVLELMNFLKPQQTVADRVTESSVADGVTAILSEFDPQNGGFGTAPKFPMPGAIEFLIGQYFLTGNESAGFAIRKTLESMAKGGIHDQLGGGFHRYSVDEAWIIPHFEKMAEDNAWLLRNYLDAYCLFKDELFRDVAKGIISFVTEVLSDPGGGFYASQDADVTPDDEGGYFTWTDEAFRSALSDEEYRILSNHLLHEKGSMHHDRSKKVLFIATEPEVIAAETGLGGSAVREIISAGKKKLHRERARREQPLVDRTLYTGINGLFATSYLKAFRVLEDEALKEFALKSIRRIMGTYYVNGELFHAEGVGALLDDHMKIIEALIAAYETTGETVYRDQADELMGQCLERFWDRAGGGFFDTEEEIVGVRLKGIEDIPHPSANAMAVMNLMKLYYVTDRESYLRHAEKALASFSVRAKDMGIHAGYFLRGTDSYYRMIKLLIEADPGSPFGKVAFSSFHPFVTISYGSGKGYVTPCRRGSCYEALYDPAALRKFLEGPLPSE